MKHRSAFGLARAASGAVVSALALLVACGQDRPPAGVDARPDPAAGRTTDAGASKPPVCGQANDGTYCDCVDVPLFADPPNLYFVLDRSGSMAEDDKWESVRATVGSVLRSIGPRARFAAAAFPTVAGDDECAVGSEIMPLRPGDRPSNGVDGPTTLALMLATQPPPSGGTPTAATLRSLFDKIRSYPGKTFVILATDGGPNCNTSATCEAAQCIPNIESYPGCSPTSASCCGNAPDLCLDGAPAVSAVAAYQTAGIPVYVIGMPGSAAYATLLDQMAEAGGTALPSSPKYYRVDSSSSSQLLTTLKKVAAKIVATCEFKLKGAPFDPGLVNVYLDEVITPQSGNWTLDGDTVTLVGGACDRVMGGDVLDVRIITGCPTVIR